MKKMILASCAVIAFAGCKGRNNNPITAAKAVAADTDLQGTFDGTCNIDAATTLMSRLATWNDAAIQSERVSYDIKTDDLTRTTTYYTKADCSDEAFKLEEIGSVANVKKSGNPNDGYTIDMRFRKLEGTALSDAGAKVANALEWCAVKDWSKNKNVDVTSKSADATCYGVKEPRSLYNVYRVDAGTLTLGTDKLEENAPDSRATGLSAGPFNKK